MIESASYTPSGSVVIVSGGQSLFVPDDPRNRHRQELDAWLAAGNSIGPAMVNLAEFKAQAKAQISAKAEASRGKVLTLVGPGKGMSYTKVAQEAATYVATQGAGAYPFLAARVASGRYANLADAAAGPLAIENATAMAAAAIDEIEDRAKLQIDAATTVEQVQAAATVTWP